MKYILETIGSTLHNLGEAGVASHGHKLAPPLYVVLTNLNLSRRPTGLTKPWQTCADST